MTQAPPIYLTYGIAAVMTATILYVRRRRLVRPRPLRLGTLWIAPVLFLAIAVSTLLQFPPGPHDWPWLVGAALAGIAFGWQRGRLMDIWLEQESGQWMVQGSRWAPYFLVALVFLRLGLRGTLEMEFRAGAISPALIHDGFVLFALGLFATQRAEMAWRTLKLARAQITEAPQRSPRVPLPEED